MKAALLWEPGRITVEERPSPKPRPGWTIIKVMACGICGSDMLVWRGHVQLPKTPLVLGHEFAGEVYEVDPQSSGFDPGDRVAVEPIVCCGKCSFCLAGDYNLCPSMQILGWQYDGGFEEYVSVPTKNLIKVSSPVDMAHIALTDCFALAVHAINKIPTSNITSVGIVGDGMIALSTLLITNALLNPEQVSIIGKHPHNLEIATHAGAAFSVSTEERKKIEELSGTCDLVFEAVGSSECAFADALSLVKPGGCLALLGLQEQPLNVLLSRLIHKEIILLGVHAYSSFNGRRDFVTTVRLIEDGLIDVATLITHQIPLEQISTGFQMLDNKKESHAIKVIVNPSRNR